MEEPVVEEQLLQELLRRVVSLEENVAFLEVWCEEQQDALDRVGETVFYVDEPLDGAPGQGHLRVVDLRDVEPFDEAAPGEESEYERRVNHLDRAFAGSATACRPAQPISATPAGRRAP